MCFDGIDPFCRLTDVWSCSLIGLIFFFFFFECWAYVVNYVLNFSTHPSQAKALAEKNDRNLQAQREQAERQVRISRLQPLISFLHMCVPSWKQLPDIEFREGWMADRLSLVFAVLLPKIIINNLGLLAFKFDVLVILNLSCEVFRCCWVYFNIKICRLILEVWF